MLNTMNSFCWFMC